MDREVLVERSGVSNDKIRPGFNHKVIRGLSIAVLALGIVCFCAGVATLVITLVSRCAYENHEYDRYGNYVTRPPYIRGCDYNMTFISPGLWCGLIFLSSGIIGIVTARRKTTCFIVSVMALSVVAAWIALCGMVTSVMAHFDKHYSYGYMETDYPISLHVLDSIITLICLACFVMFWIKFGYTCRAICCNGRKGLPEINSRHQYQPLPLQPQPMFGQQSQPQPQTMPVYNPPPSTIPPTTEPVYLVQGHRVIGVLPQAMTGGVPQRDDAAATPTIKGQALEQA